jgi:hypothetical protein
MAINLFRKKKLLSTGLIGKLHHSPGLQGQLADLVLPANKNTTPH